MDIIIREIDKTEIPFLEHFLYEAIFIPKGKEKQGKEIIKLPELSRYINNFGKETDICLVADLNGQLIGAIWTRVFTETKKGFGYVDSKTPELSMSINYNYRQQGIGTNLLKTIINKLTQLKYEQVSLSVNKENYALNLYEKFNFNTIEMKEESAIMTKQLKK
jgi:ribosomal protein S18 acetylase RimI-like enzyme